jgi:hypothetical protein
MLVRYDFDGDIIIRPSTLPDLVDELVESGAVHPGAERVNEQMGFNVLRLHYKAVPKGIATGVSTCLCQGPKVLKGAQLQEKK